MEMTARSKLNRNDWLLVAICIAVTAVSAAVIAKWFTSAFPEASIEFRYDRNSSRRVAESLLTSQGMRFETMKHAASFDSDDSARVFLERNLGLQSASRLMGSQVRIWYWHHRWYKPLQEEELNVDVAPTGEIVSMTRTIPEAMPLPAIDPASARKLAEDFLARTARAGADLDLVAQSERQLPNRLQRIFTWESRSIRPAGATYRHTVTVDGNAVSSYAQQLKVPEEWLRQYAKLRAKNSAAGGVDLVLMAITMIAALAVFIARLRRGDLRIRFLIGIGIASIVLVGAVTANSIPSALGDYDTTSSYAAFIARLVIMAVIQSIGTAMLLIVICGAGEALYRERLPGQLALPRIFTPKALASKRVFLSLVLGYSLVAFFIGYQTIFYVVAARFGAWAPADVPYDEILNTALPWVAVLFAGFFPALSEEFLSRAFSIPFFHRVLRSRVAAIVLAGFIWGFGHSTYPNQPFYIRGLEVGLAGVLLGFLMDRFGLVALLVWHYTVDAVYTALLLFRSHNTYYVTSAALASLVFAIPLIVSIALYIRNRGFRPDDDLTNASLPAAEPLPPPALIPATPLPPGIPSVRVPLLLFVLLAIIVVVRRPPAVNDVVDYATGGSEAESIARRHLRFWHQQPPLMSAVAPVSAFRSWEDDSPREEGGSPGGFDSVAATYMLRHGMSVNRLIQVMKRDVEAATWTVRFFTPLVKTEYFVEVDPRSRRVIGYHKYADERAPGAHLDREAALRIAVASLPVYGVLPADFDVKEALAFQQPNRRDWLFHFEERKPLIAQAVRRVTVRVMGDELTQFATTVKVPESVYRDAQRQTLVNVVLITLKIAASVLAVALVIAGFVIVTRNGIEWRRAAKITAALAAIPLIDAAARYRLRLFDYSTQVSWDTFLVQMTTGLVGTVGFQIAILFVAVAGILTARPFAPQLLSREGRARFGRSAIFAAGIALSLLLIGREATRAFAHLFPSLATVREVSVPDTVVLAMPSFLEAITAVFDAVMLSGAVSLIAAAIGGWRQTLRALVIPLLVFAIGIDTHGSAREMPLIIATSAAFAVLVWIIARYVLDGNALAWPVAAFIGSVAQSAAALAQNHRPDLQVHAALLVLLGIAVAIWLARLRESEAEAPPPAES